LDCDAPLTNICRKNIHDNVVHTEANKAAFETLKSRMISALAFLIPNEVHDAIFLVATDASNVGITGMLLQEDISISLRPYSYWAKKLKDYESKHSAYDREVMAVVEVVSRV
jgi:hypothetical protein